VTSWFTSPKIKLSEDEVEEACLGFLRPRGYWPARLHCGTFKSADSKRWIKGLDKGTPDYALEHAFYPGFLLETKATGESLSVQQRIQQQMIRQYFRLAIVTVDSVEALEKWLEGHERAAQERWKRFLIESETGPMPP